MVNEFGEENWYEREFRDFIFVGHSLHDFVASTLRKTRRLFPKKPEIILTGKALEKMQPPPGMTEEDKERTTRVLRYILGNIQAQYVDPLRDSLEKNEKLRGEVERVSKAISDLEDELDPYLKMFKNKPFEEVLELLKTELITAIRNKAQEFMGGQRAEEIATQVFRDATKLGSLRLLIRKYEKQLYEHAENDRRKHDALDESFGNLEDLITETSSSLESTFSKAVADLKATTEKSRRTERIIYISGVAALIAAAAATVFLTYSNNSKTRSEILASQQASEAKLNQVYSMTSDAKTTSEQTGQTIVGKISGLETTLNTTLTEISKGYQQILVDYKQIVSVVEDIKQIYQSQLEMSKADSQRIDASLGILDERFKKLGATLSQYENYAEQNRIETKGNLEELSRSVESSLTSLQQVSKSQVSSDRKIEEVLFILTSIQGSVSNFSYELERLKTPASQPSSQPAIPQLPLEFNFHYERRSLYEEQTQPQFPISPKLEIDYHPSLQLSQPTQSQPAK